MTLARLSTYQCAYCGELNDTLIDGTGGKRQEYVEDCAVCCHPNVLTIVLDEETGEISIEAEFEG